MHDKVEFYGTDPNAIMIDMGRPSILDGIINLKKGDNKMRPYSYLVIYMEDGIRMNRILRDGVMLARNEDEVRMSVARSLTLSESEKIEDITILVKTWCR
jgi:hypothetical protein